MLQEKKYLRGNNKSFMTKTLSKSIMERMRLRKIQLSEKSNCCKQIGLHKTKKFLCVTSNKSKKGIFCKPKRMEYY